MLQPDKVNLMTCKIIIFIMIKSVTISRLIDGLIFCETNENYSNVKAQEARAKVRQFHLQVTMFSKQQNIPMRQIQHQNFLIVFKVSAHVVFTLIAEKHYPIKLAYSFLDSIIAPFFQEARCILGTTNLQTRLESIETSHYFVKFDRTIKSKRNEFQDPSSVRNVERMKRELQDIHSVVKQNLNLLAGRQSDLQRTGQAAQRINEQSKRFHQTTKKVLWHYWLRKNAIFLVLIFLVASFYFFFF